MFLILSTCWHFLFSFWRLQTWLLSSRATSWRTWWSWLNWSRSSSCCTTRPQTAPEVTSYRSWRKLWPCASNPSTCPPLKVPSSDPPHAASESFFSELYLTWIQQSKGKKTNLWTVSISASSVACLLTSLPWYKLQWCTTVHKMNAFFHKLQKAKSMQEVPGVLSWTSPCVTCWMRWR